MPEASAANPWVGPRPFERGERLYGREAEIRELRYLWMAERIVLFHSPSGAGKSSMLQAGLLPRVEGSFDVWGPTRVHQELPAEVDPSANRYATSSMLGFEEGVPESLRRSAGTLAGLRLADYVATRPRQRGKAQRPVALVFDQFEEILTADPLAVDAKREFFDQLGELLRDPRIWALFVLREDYLAPLDPYAAQVPTHLENRFRIDLLGLDGAREAIVRPARAGGREFPAADRLVRDLATRKVQQADGSFVEEVGVHVEPVQLQVVCFRLWDAMPPDDRSIDDGDLDRFGDVTESLAGYYADSVERIAGGAQDRERAIRDWFGTRLIRAGDVRGQVLRGTESSDGLDHATIAELLDTHLVRAESRAGATWYELAHDRLIAPVRADNARWRAEHLSEIQERAALWVQKDHAPGLLLRDEALAEAEAWIQGTGVVATAVEIRFLEASHEAQEALDRERRQTARIRRLGVAAMVIAVLALGAGAVAGRLWRLAETQRDVAEAERARAAEWLAAATGADLLDRQPNRATLTLLEVDDPVATPAAFAALYEALVSRLLVTFRGHEHKVTSATFCADGSRVVTTSLDGTVRVWDVQTGDELAVFRPVRGDDYVGASLDHDGNRVALVTRSGVGSIGSVAKAGAPALLADAGETLGEASFAPILGSPWWSTTSRDGVVRVRSSVTGEVEATLAEESESIVDTAVSADGRRVATASADGVVRVWDAGTWLRLGEFRDDDLRRMEVALSDDGTRVVGFASRVVRVWDVASGRPSMSLQTSQTIQQARLSPDGSRLALAVGRSASLYAVDTGTRLLSVTHNLPVRAIAFGVGGKVLVMAEANRALIWNIDSDQEIATLTGHALAITDLAVDPTGLRAVTASADGTASIWRIGRAEIPGNQGVFSPSGLSLATISGTRVAHLATHDLAEIATFDAGATIRYASFDPSGEQVVTASDDFTATIWSARSGEVSAVLDEHESVVVTARFSADGERVVTASASTARLWSAVDGSLLATFDGASGLRDASFSPDGEIVMTVGHDDTARLWAAAPPYAPLGILGGAGGDIFSARFDPGGARVVTADGTDTARVWRVADGEVLSTLGGHTDDVVAASFAPDGSRVVTASADGTSRVFDAGSGALIAELRGHLGPLTTASFSPDGHRVLTASEDRTVRLWNAATGEELAIIGTHLGAVHQAAFSPDGGTRLLSTSDADGTRLWPHDLDLLLAINRARAYGCLDVRFRESMLGEPPTVARRRNAACEHCRPVFVGSLEAEDSSWRSYAAAWRAYSSCLAGQLADDASGP